MSASLVGSEMCIRDRQSPWPALRTAARSPRGMTDAAGHRRAARYRTASVSYTHLTLPTICSV
eukprot:1417695-Alexandrium_andersonii.AAC.1